MFLSVTAPLNYLKSIWRFFMWCLTDSLLRRCPPLFYILFCFFRIWYIISTLKPFVKKNFNLFSWRWGWVATIKLVCYLNPYGFPAHYLSSKGALFSRFYFFSKYTYIISTLRPLVKKKIDLFPTNVVFRRRVELLLLGWKPSVLTTRRTELRFAT